MGRYRLNAIRTLARQMAFTPAAKRLAQLAAAEALAGELSADRGYPASFVTYRVTEFRGKSDDHDTNLLAGEALRHDLGLLVEEVSATLDLRSDQMPEPVLDISTAAERFGVSTKSIQRWRRKGLVARRFTFPDGKGRIGFLLSSVERYLAGGGQPQADGSAVDDSELRRMANMARRLANHPRGSTEAEVCRRVARRFGRTRAAVLHSLRHHDELTPSAAVLPRLAPPLAAAEQERAADLVAAGRSLAEVAGELGRSRSVVGRSLLAAEADRLADLPTRHVDDDLFTAPDAEAQIAELCCAGELSGRHEPARVPAGLPPYLADLYRTPLLTPARERALFLQYNFHRKRFADLRAARSPAVATRRELMRLRDAHSAATAAKNAIVQANLRLVVSVARKHLRAGLDLMELVSDGNVVLMRAVDGFDVGKGNKFSTYATFALMKGFARSVPAMQSRPAATLVGDVAGGGAEFEQTLADREAAGVLLGRLDDEERDVLLAHRGFALDGDGSLREADAQTLDQVGQRLGLSRHRVRQIERDAIEKLVAG